MKEYHRLLLITGLILGFALRLYQLGADSLWYDETVSAYLASLPVTQMIAHTAGDIHPPGYYVLLHLWHLASQPTITYGLEFLLAWPSLWCGLLILPLLYKIGCILFTPRVALIALWLAAINPFHIWYSQEVRMYTLGAMLGLICFYALLKIAIQPPATNSGDARFRQAQPTWRAKLPYYLAYTLAAALGLYTLYYFIFLWITLNLIALWLFIVRERKNRTRMKADERGYSSSFTLHPFHWLLTQCAALALWLPWLPTFWQQATNPPVPPWRDPWQTFPQFINSLTETFSTLLIGQSNFIDQNWPWAVLAVLVVAFTVNYQQSTINYQLFPIALIYLTTWLITPLYHVRYLFIYAPPFMLLLAVILVRLWNMRQLYGIFAALLIAIINSLSLHAYWTGPANTSDDHRTAVVELAQAWHPGDLILVNAGWVYTALETYWPTELVGADGVLYPSLTKPQRLLDVCGSVDCPPAEKQVDNLLYIRTGSVDGSTNLGWGNPASDFFAISQSETEAALHQLANTYSRIWHYRLYDTVNDSDGVIRSWLGQHTTLQKELTYPGRDFLQVQLYTTDKIDDSVLPSASGTPTKFGEVLYLQAYQAPTSHRAGEPLYITLWWEPLEKLSADLNMSLRLYDGSGILLNQSDQAPLLPTTQWSAGEQYTQQLVLPVEAASKPGMYTLELVVYGQNDGVPLSLAADERVIYGQRWRVATVQLEPPQSVPEIRSVLAQFDYIDLVSAGLKTVDIQLLEVSLVWRPRPNDYQDTYRAIFALEDSRGEVVQTWAELAGGDGYPSGQWVVGMPVRERRLLPLEQPLSVGAYRLMLKVERASDGLVIPVSQGWWPLEREWIEVGGFGIE